MKKNIIIFLTTIGIGCGVVSTAYAEDSESSSIVEVLNQILSVVQEFATSFQTYSDAWLNPDTSDSYVALLPDLSNYMTNTWNNIDVQNSIQRQLTNTMLNNATPPTFINDVSYMTVLGEPYQAQDSQGNDVDPKAATLNYVTNISAANVTHDLPKARWQGSAKAKSRYENFIKTIMSVQTYNQYVLSDFYANVANERALTQTQIDLKNKLTDQEGWFKHVSEAENIGNILREILMFQSQLYLVSLQSIEAQRQLIASIAATNSLIILGNQFTEDTLKQKAGG